MAQSPFDDIASFFIDARGKLDEALKQLWQQPSAALTDAAPEEPAVQNVVTGPDLTLASFKRRTLSTMFPDVQQDFQLTISDPYDIPQLQHHLDKALMILAVADLPSSTREDGNPLDAVDRVLLRKAALNHCRIYVQEAKALRRAHCKQQKQHSRRASHPHRHAAAGFVGVAVGVAAIKAVIKLAKHVARVQHDVRPRHTTRASAPCLVAA